MVFANEQGILTPPDVVTNNGSAIAAGMEPSILAAVDSGEYATVDECIEGILIPYILLTAKKNVKKLLAAA